MSTAASTPPSPTPAVGLTLEAFTRLLRARRDSLEAYLGVLGTTAKLGSTEASIHCRYLKIDGLNSPRVHDLADRLAQEVINYAIPRSQIEEALEEADSSHDTRRLAALYRKAIGLFTHLATTGEGGELLLYLLAETYLRLPQLLCKMPLKTSADMHYHGADGVHGTYDRATGTLALYWGESKLHAGWSDAIDACLKSLAPFLLAEGRDSRKRDLELLRDNVDLGDPHLEAALLRYLDRDDPSYNLLTFRGVALVGFDSDSYSPAAGALSETMLCAELGSRITNWHKSISYHLEKHSLTKIAIELFCIPFPSVEAFRAAFLKELGIT